MSSIIIKQELVKIIDTKKVTQQNATYFKKITQE